MTSLASVLLAELTSADGVDEIFQTISRVAMTIGIFHVVNGLEAACMLC